MFFLEGTATEGATSALQGNSWITIVIYLAVIVVAFYFLLIRPQKKKQKDEKKMRDSLQIGDEILTIGGFYARVVSIKEDSIVVESQLDHTKQKMARWAIQQNLTVHDDTPANTK